MNKIQQNICKFKKNNSRKIELIPSLDEAIRHDWFSNLAGKKVTRSVFSSHINDWCLFDQEGSIEQLWVLKKSFVVLGTVETGFLKFKYLLH